LLAKYAQDIITAIDVSGVVHPRRHRLMLLMWDTIVSYNDKQGAYRFRT
jgi:hypothetical protein